MSGASDARGTSAPSTSTPGVERQSNVFWKPGAAQSQLPPSAGSNTSSAATSAFWKPGAGRKEPSQVSRQPQPREDKSSAGIESQKMKSKPPSQSEKNLAAAQALRARLLGKNKSASTASSSSRGSAPDLAPLERGDLRTGSKRGKRFTSGGGSGTSSQHYTGIRDLLREAPAENMDEVFARNVMKQGKKFAMPVSSRSGRDEEDQHIDHAHLYESTESQMTQRR